jgi:opacity protein-like surface antigen
MKSKFLTVAALVCTFFYANAQQDPTNSDMYEPTDLIFNRGDMFVEGSLKISTGDDVDFYAVNPKVGYFLNDKFAVGGQVSWSSYEEEATDTKTDVLGIGAFARYYFLQLDDKRFKAYGEAGLGFGKNKTEIAGFEDNSNSVTADINVGLNYFFTKNLAATFVLANVLSYNTVSPEDGASANTFKLNINLFENIFDQPQFGLLYKF